MRICISINYKRAVRPLHWLVVRSVGLSVRWLVIFSLNLTKIVFYFIWFVDPFA